MRTPHNERPDRGKVEAPKSADEQDRSSVHRATDQTDDPAGPTYDARPAKRARATRQQMEARYARLVELAAEHHPCSVRHLFYRATVDKLEGIGKDAAGYRKVQRAALKLRRDGRIPYSWIVDNSRTVFRVDTFDGVAGFLDDMAGLYRRDLWRRSPYRVEVWTESDSIAGTLLDVARTWRVPLYPIRGQSSETFAYNAVQEWNDGPDRLPVVLYIGDHDPAGLEIETALADKLAGFADGITPPPRFVRLGVTWQQVVDLDLPGTKPKKDYGFPLAVEAEALPPRMLRELVDDAIGAYVNTDELDTLLAVEAEERDGLHRLAGRFAA